jgi:hypothetical protein
MATGIRSFSGFLGMKMMGFILAAATLLFTAPANASENISLLDQALDNVRASGLYFRVDLSLEVFNATDQIPTVLLNTSSPITAPLPTSTTGTTATGNAGTVTLSDSAQGNLSSLVNVIGAGSVINVGVNVLSITNSSSDTIYTTNTNYGVLGGASSPVPVVP